MKYASASHLGATAIGAPSSWSGDPSELSETQWASICVARLTQLRPFSEPQALMAMASDMARSLRYFDPAMAAEMEHEGGMLDD
ncbi:MAG: hypothetical protein M3O01_01470 [Pseudomonadota bacterium]|nr:hypothetical protein [Pseudomonadota bacterium]